jgi:hypothetical protein
MDITPFENPYMTQLMLEIDNLMKTIITYVPLVYWVPCRYHQALFPYSIIYNIAQQAALKNITSDSIIISSNTLDASSLGLQIEGVMEIFIYRKSSSYLYNYKTFIGDYLLKSKHYNKEYMFGKFRYLFPRVLLAYSKKYIQSIEVPQDIEKIYRYGVSHILQANNYKEHDDAVDYLIRMEKDDPVLLEYVYRADISSQYPYMADTLQQEKLMWKHDRIDYSIERLNNDLFIEAPID